MKIGFMGLGKLGLPCALAIEGKGHEVCGCDPSAQVVQILESRKLQYLEKGAQEALSKSRIQLVTADFLVRNADIIFVAVQTPHGPEYEGTTPVPKSRRDFDYQYLREAAEVLCREIELQQVPKTVVIISTVLPGTVRMHLRPIIERHGVSSLFRLCYNPFFIAMGTAMEDFLNPEFVLLGADRTEARKVKEFYATIHDRPVYETTVENAELIKVAYNTFIGMKIVFANTMMEICHKTPNTSVDDVSDALSLATGRLLSPKYLRGGMGDGGGCHPRDNIALSWLARELKLSHNFFDDIIQARDDQTKWLADIIIEEHRRTGLPIVLLGLSFKSDTNISTGSPAKLLSHYLLERGYTHTIYDPHCFQVSDGVLDPSLFFISSRHEVWRKFGFPGGSVVIDPWRYIANRFWTETIQYIPVGIHP